MVRFLAALALTFSVTQSSIARTYRIHPVAFGDGYEILGGHIEMIGRLGLFSGFPSEVVSYSLRVKGPHTRPRGISINTAGRILMRRVEATPTELKLVIDTVVDSSRIDSESSLFIHGDYLDPRQSIYYQVEASWINSYYLESGSEVDHSRIRVGEFGGSFLPVTGSHLLETSPQKEIVIASVPEPTTSALALAGFYLLLARSPRFQSLLAKSRRSISKGKGLSRDEFWQAVRRQRSRK